MRDVLVGKMWPSGAGLAICQELLHDGRYRVQVITSQDFIMDGDTIRKVLEPQDSREGVRPGESK